ncbi:alpha/beta hydrolase [Capnocytophaga sp.]|uniref:RBBP9/YdeN family alpha/beta hydrolase n=1 Tax=Capnocytophaga sp. TaxID=44737 RepID=UPI0026DABAE4|nr:alpha/beta hydrolase [Capnocytophaga sp.]MDO5106446.1 alpha/beta hydrolase [Capnocytophaga sp.]
MRAILFILTLFISLPLLAQNKEVTKSEKQVYIIHGYDASIDKHWFKWLSQELEKQGIKAYRLAMPTPAQPQSEAWLEKMKKEVKINHETVIVAHSLGTITTLNFLCESEKSVKGTILVSGFYEPISKEFAFLNPFVEKFAQRKNQPKVGNSVVITALDDGIVPQRFSDNLSQLLQSKFIRLPKGGHFLDREGFTTFPLVLNEVLKIFNEHTND